MNEVAHALADSNRREILRLLRAAPQNAGTVAEHFSISRPAISRHLRVLRQAGLVSTEVVGRQRTYRLRLEPLQQLQAFLAELQGSHRWTQRFDALATEVHRVKRSRRDDDSSPNIHTSPRNQETA